MKRKIKTPRLVEKQPKKRLLAVNQIKKKKLLAIKKRLLAVNQFKKKKSLAIKNKTKLSWFEEDLAEETTQRESSFIENLERVRSDVRRGASPAIIGGVATGSETGSDFDEGARLCSTRPGDLLSALECSRFVTSMNQLSVSSVNVPECKPLLDGEEIHRHTYESWKDLLIDSMALAGIQDETTKFIVFKVKAGARLLEIFRNTKSNHDAPVAEVFPFSNAMHRLTTYFGSGSDVMLQRRKLATMTQNAEETDLVFITRVGATARLCNFGDGKEFEEIVATVAEHARSREVRVAALKMLSRSGTFTDLIDKVREIETVRLNEEFHLLKHGKMEHPPSHPTIAQVSTEYRHNTSSRQSSLARGSRNGYGNRREASRRNFTHPGSRRPIRGGFNRNQSQAPRPFPTGEQCYRCLGSFHAPSECQARDKICRNCGLIGHYQRACKNTSAIPSSSRMEPVESKDIAAVGTPGNDLKSDDVSEEN